LKILVTGGAGYIGSHMNLVLQDEGHEVTVFDNLSRGFKDAVIGATLIERDPARLIGDASLAKTQLHWTPRYRDLGDIIETAWQFMLKKN
jgi:UDP-glucose 4-epimerase